MNSDVTIVVPVRNESINIERCLVSCHLLTNKIVIYDMGDDDTAIKAKNMGARVIDWRDDEISEFISVQNAVNDASKHCTSKWMLRVDADEELTPELVEEINMATKEKDSDVAAYGVPRAQYFIWKFLYWGDWGYDRLVRLWKVGYARYERIQDTHVHEQLTVNGRVGLLNARLKHYSHPNWETLYNKFQKYTNIESRQLKISKFQAFVKLFFVPLYVSARWIIYHQGYRDGALGIVAGFVRGWYDWLKYAKYLGLIKVSR